MDCIVRGVAESDTTERLSFHSRPRHVILTGIVLAHWVSLVAQCEASACSAGDTGSIPGSGRSPGEGNGNPLQYSFWEIPWTEEPGGSSLGHKRVGHDLATKHSNSAGVTYYHRLKGLKEHKFIL